MPAAASIQRLCLGMGHGNESMAPDGTKSRATTRAPDSIPPRRRLAFACLVETTSSHTRSTQMTASSAQ